MNKKPLVLSDIRSRAGAFGAKRTCRSEQERQELLFTRYAELAVRGIRDAFQAAQ